MMTVKATAMVSLVCALAAVTIAASLKDPVRSAPQQPGPTATLVPVKAAAPGASAVPFPTY